MEIASLGAIEVAGSALPGPDYASIPAFSGSVTSLSIVPWAISTTSMLPEEDSLEKVLYNTWQSCLSWDSGISQLQAFNKNWENEAWKKADELRERVCAMYPVSEEHSKRYREIWSDMIEGYKREASEEKKKSELQNLQSFVNYGDIKASSSIGIGKTRPSCCRVVCLGGLWVVP
jgi:hypothetical protein